jgi:hypothetical protein
MTGPERKRAVEVMQMIQADVETDTERREGLPFTARNVAGALGELAAQIGAVARTVELLLHEQEVPR